MEDMSQYPFMKYIEEGIKVTFNKDDIGIEGTSLTKEYRHMEKTFGLTAKQEKILWIPSMRHSQTKRQKKNLKKN